MAKRNMWEDNERVSEIDLIEQGNSDYAVDEPARRSRPNLDRNQPQQQQREEVYPSKDSGESPYKLNKGDRDVVRTVTFKLEQARIYEALIKSDLFEGFEADPNAISNVKTELKDFLVERLDNLMGGGQSKKKTQIDFENLSFDLPFNEEEIMFLKALALTGTKGASAGGSTATVTAKPTYSEKPRNVIRGLAKSEKPKIAPIKRSEAKPKYVEPIYEEYEEEEEIEEEEMPAPRAREPRREEYKEPVRRKSSKKASQMTEDDIRTRNEEIEREQKSRKSGIPANALPMPTAAQMEGVYNSRHSSQSGFNDMINLALKQKK